MSGPDVIPRDCRQGGSFTIELVILTPVIVLFLLLALSLGRYELAREQVVGAARAGAEAASVVAAPGDAQTAAFGAAAPVVADQARSCRQLRVSADTSHFAPGGSVRVVVTCQIEFSDSLIPGLPGQASVEATEVAPIDPFRSVQ